MSVLNYAKNLFKTQSSDLFKYLEYSTKQTETVPQLVYFTNPFTLLMTKFQFALLKFTWDPDFNEDEFKRGAAVVSLNLTLIEYRCSQNNKFSGCSSND